MKKLSFVICSPDYNPESGGIICLHKLAQEISLLGFDCYIAPFRTENSDYNYSTTKFISKKIKHLWNANRAVKSPYTRTQAISYNDAVSLANNNTLFIYPENVLGNPYRAKHIARWLLHFPMHWTKSMHWGLGDIVIRFNDAVPLQKISGIHCPEQFLKIVHYPIETYQKYTQPEKKGSAYLVRKGKNKSFIHPSDSICIDNLNHTEAAKILGRVEKFYSYDPYTAYSLFAVIAGAKSIVVPDDGITKEEWYPSIEDRFGIAYGENDSAWAVQTKNKVLPRLIEEERKNTASTINFIELVTRIIQDIKNN